MKWNGTNKELLSIALPIMAGSLSQNIISLTDTAFLGHLGETELGAIVIASILYVCLQTLVFGFGRSLQVIIAKLNGENNPTQIGKTFDQALWLGLLLIFSMYALAGIFNAFVLKLTVSSVAIQDKCMAFLNWRLIGVPFDVFFILFSSLYNGLGKNKIVFFSSFVTVVINVIFNYLLVFGVGGFPAMGMGGSGLASSIAGFCSFLVLFIYAFKENFILTYKYFKNKKIDIGIQKEIWKLGLPMTIQISISLISWLSFFLVIENMGETPLAASNLMKTIYMFIAIPIWAFNSTINTAVSNFMGQGRSNEIYNLVTRSIYLCLVFVLPMTVLLLIFPKQIYACFSPDLVIINLTHTLTYFVCFCLLLFPISTSIFNTIVGIGDARYSLYIELSNVAIYLAYIFGVSKFYNANLLTVWYAELLYWVVSAFMALLYLKYYPWQKKFEVKKL